MGFGSNRGLSNSTPISASLKPASLSVFQRFKIHSEISSSENPPCCSRSMSRMVSLILCVSDSRLCSHQDDVVSLVLVEFPAPNPVALSTLPACLSVALPSKADISTKSLEHPKSLDCQF